MSKGGSKNGSKEKIKALKREKAKIKARRKTFIIISILILVVVAAAVVGINFRNQNNKKASSGEIVTRNIQNSDTQQAEAYSLGRQTVHLFEDGTFSARLAHNVNKDGTYTRAEESGRSRITFNSGGRAEDGWIINDSLHMPHEWEDGHGHGSVFPRSK